MTHERDDDVGGQQSVAEGRVPEVVELRGGHVWELTTASGERVVVDRGFRANGGSIRDRWRVEPDGAWQRLFWVGSVGAEPAANHDEKRRLPVTIGARIELHTGFRDVWRTDSALVAVWEGRLP